MASTNKKIIHFELRSKAIRAPDFIRFMSECLSRMRCQRTAYRKPFIILYDNAPCHKAKIVDYWLEENNASCFAIAPYCLQANFAEKVFIIIKRRLSKRLREQRYQFFRIIDSFRILSRPSIRSVINNIAANDISDAYKIFRSELLWDYQK